MASHNKSVDSPQLHRGLRRMTEEHTPASAMMHQGLDGNFRIGEKAEHVEPEWKSSQRYGCKREDTANMLSHVGGGDGSVGRAVPRKQFDQGANTDWTGTTGSSVQKVLTEDEKKRSTPASHVKSRGDSWSSSSCSKVIENSSPQRQLVIEKEPITFPNEKTKKDPHHPVSGWNTENGKTVEQPPKRQLNLAPQPPKVEPPKPLSREEDWDSNLKTLPNCAKGVERKPHVFSDVKESVVPQPSISRPRQF